MNRFGAGFATLGIGVLVSGFALLPSVAASDTAPVLVPVTPAGTQGTAKAPLMTSFGALDYFETKCARCHGDYGAFYGDTFGKNLSDTKMHDVVRDMAAGPSQAPLETRDLAVLVAWHCALRDKKPFIAVVKAEPLDKGWKLSGEVSPGATLQLNGAPVTVEDHTWTASTTSQSPLQLQAKLGDQTTTLDALQAAYTAP